MLIALVTAAVAPPVNSSSASQVPVAGPPALSCRLDGGGGDVVVGVADTSPDCADVPALLTAATLYQYVVPLVSPVSVKPVDVAVPTGVAPSPPDVVPR